MPNLLSLLELHSEALTLTPKERFKLNLLVDTYLNKDKKERDTLFGLDGFREAVK